MVGGKAGTVYKLCPVCNAGRTGTNGFQMLIMPLSVRMQELAAPIQSIFVSSIIRHPTRFVKVVSSRVILCSSLQVFHGNTEADSGTQRSEG